MICREIVIENTYFGGNQAELGGDDICAESNSEIIRLDGMVTQNFWKNSIRGVLTSFEIENSEFASNLLAAEEGGGLLCENCPELTIRSSVFKELKAFEGGAMYLKQDSSLEDSITFPFLVNQSSYSN
jgi:hypothetical protein